jgi:hypothetical protein
VPDFFQPYPEWEHLDNSPRDETIPVPGITDSPAFVAVINYQWLGFFLGVIDRLGYGDVWAGSVQDKERAYHEINQWIATLMTTPYNNIRGGVSVENLTYSTGALSAGNGSLVPFDTTDGAIVMLTHITVRLNTGTLGRLFLKIDKPTGEDYIIFDQSNPPSSELFTISSEIFMGPVQELRLQWVSASAGATIQLSASYVYLINP